MLDNIDKLLIICTIEVVIDVKIEFSQKTQSLSFFTPLLLKYLCQYYNKMQIALIRL